MTLRGRRVTNHGMDEVEKRFWNKVDKTGDCWIYLGSKNTSGYGQFRSMGKRMVAHRFAWLVLNGPVPPKMDLDHICHNRACVNPSHLRIATRSENIINSRVHQDSTSGLKGASWNKREGKWASQIVVNYKRIFLGYFPSAQLAHEAYITAAQDRFGVFANRGV